jgi:cell division protein FtsL
VSAVTAPLRPAHPTDQVRGPHLQVVEEPTRRHTVAFALAILVILGVAIFAAVSLNALAAATSIEGRELDLRVAEAERHYAQLVADVAALEDPARIRDAAADLGLVPADDGRYLPLDRNLPADGAPSTVEVREGPTDPLKPVLSVER